MSVVSPRPGRVSAHNWLVHKIHDEALTQKLREYASGVLVDIGCGDKPFAATTKGLVKQHIGIDHIARNGGHSGVDLLASAYATGLSDASADIVLCTAVLEHLECPERALQEVHRILKPGGYVILSAPLFWHLHDEPKDYYRYTRFGLEHLLTKAQLHVVEISPLSGFVVTFTQELCYLVDGFRRRYTGWLVSVTESVLQSLAYCLRGLDTSHAFTWMYLVVAQKPTAGDSKL